MKFNWGTGIVLGAAGFTTFISVMVYKCMQQDFDLVAKDYYAQELNYESQIKRINNTLALESKFSVEYDDQSTALKIVFPTNAVPVSSGSVTLYKPDNASSDRKYDMDLSGTTQSIPAGNLPPGAWDVNLTWTSGGNEYFQKERIYIYK